MGEQNNAAKLEDLKVVILEDSNTDLLILKKMLLELGFRRNQISEYGTLSDLRIVDEDLVISDLNLPDSRGRDTLQKVLKVAKDKGVFVIVLSGLADEKLAQESIQMGAQDYLIKATFGTGVLRKTLSFAFERFRLMQSRGIGGPKDFNQALTKEALTLIPSTVFHCSEDLIIDFQSKARHEGESTSQFMGKHIETLFPADQHALIHDQLSNVGENEPKEVIGLQWYGADDIPRSISCQVSLSNEGGYFFVLSE